MADILQITEDIPVDDSIYDYEYKEYNPIAGTNLNRGSIVLTIESQDIYTHPAESFLIIDGRLRRAVAPGVPAVADDPLRYEDADVVSLTNNGIMYLFSDVRYHLASHEIEVLQNPGHATTILGMLKYPDDFTKSQGLNQLWLPDTHVDASKVDNLGFKKRHNYIIQTAVPKGTFSFKIPLKHFLGFCEDYKKILYGMQQRLTLTRTNDNDAIFKTNATVNGVVDIEKIRWFMPHVIPSDAYRLIGNIFSKKATTKAEKHLKIKTLATAKLNTIATHVSKAMMDDFISDEEFKLIMEEMEKYKALKEEVRSNTKMKLKTEEEESLIEKGRQEARESFRRLVEKNKTI